MTAIGGSNTRPWVVNRLIAVPETDVRYRDRIGRAAIYPTSGRFSASELASTRFTAASERRLGRANREQQPKVDRVEPVADL
jgi:hypothetical protein